MDKKERRKYHKIVHKMLIKLGFRCRAAYPDEWVYGMKVIKYYWRENGYK
ncbi:hypothetical protein KA005_28415 [bacterium]|nr:hypothetical protein [bacterium]